MGEIRDMETRAEARGLGLTRYMPKRPCKRGHLSERQTSNGVCLECHQLTIARHIENVGGKEAFLKREAERTQRYEARVGDEVRKAQKRTARDTLLAKDPEYERRKALKWNRANPEKAYAGHRRYVKKLAQERPEVWKARTAATNATARAKQKGHKSPSRLELIIRKLLDQAAGCCALCKTFVGNAALELDHKRLLARGGTNDEENLQFLCGDCNRHKGYLDPDAFVPPIEKYSRNTSTASSNASLVADKLIDVPHRNTAK
jgi:5-methylcytosine-specific restriction endonuclease McrA